MPEKRDVFQNYGSHHLKKDFDKQGLSNTDLQTRLQPDTSWNNRKQNKQENAK